MTKKVYFCAGHGKHTAGKRSPSGKFEEREWFFNNEVALSFEKRMKDYDGVSLHRTDDRTGERDVPLIERTNAANRGKADLYISLHHNANRGVWENHTGVETFYHARSKEGEKLATMVQKALVKAYGLRDRGIKTKNLHITRETNMVAVLSEGGFMDSTIDIKKLRDSKVLQDAGREIADAVATYLNLKLKKKEKVKDSGKKKAEKSSNSGVLYRVRKSRNDMSSQLGAFSVLDNAKKLADKNDGYRVFDSNGVLVYTPSKKQASKPKSKPASKPKATSNPTLRIGSKGSSVSDLQRKLVNKGYSVGKAGVDGDFGKDTDKAVRQLQRDAKITVDGVVGAQTWKVVNGNFRKPSKSKKIKVGDTVKVKKSAKKFATGQTIASFVKGSSYRVIQVQSDRVLLDKVMSWVFLKDIE